MGVTAIIEQLNQEQTLAKIFCAATRKVIMAMGETDVELVETKSHFEHRPIGDISAVIQIVGQEFEILAILSMPLELTNVLAARMFGIQPQKNITDGHADLVAELINTIAGHAKNFLTQKTSRLTLPLVLFGKGNEAFIRVSSSPYLLLVFQAEGYRFTVEIAYTFG